MLTMCCHQCQCVNHFNVVIISMGGLIPCTATKLPWLLKWNCDALLMQWLLDVRRMGLQPICPTLTHQKTFFSSLPLTDTFYSGYPSSNQPCLCQNFKTSYNVVPHGDNDTERVKSKISEQLTCYFYGKQWLTQIVILALIILLP
jgi:hypothetical protein